MKKSILIIISAIFLAMPVLSYGQQETSTKETSNNEKKISYSFINEYGMFGGGTFGFTGIFVNGIRFNKTQDLLGLGVGYEADFRSEQSIPIYFNYRHYFPGKKKLQPLVNIGIGVRVSFWKEWISWYEKYYDEYSGYWYDEWYGYSNQKITPGIYATIASGFKVKSFSFTSGLFLKSWNKEYFGGAEIKVGFTF